MLSHVWLFVTPWTVAHQAPLSTGFPRQEYWSELSFSAPGDFPDPRIEPRTPASPALPGVWLCGTILKVWLMSGEFDCWHETLLISDLLSPVTTISNVPTCDSSICLVWSENWVEQSHRLTHDEPTAWMRVNLSALKPLKLVVSAPSLASSCNLAPGNLTQSKFLQKDWGKNCRSFLS